MTIYVVWSFILLCLRSFGNTIRSKQAIRLFWVAVVLVMFLIGFRSHLVGPDMPGYTWAFMGYKSGYDEVLNEQPVLLGWINFLNLIFPRHPFYFVFSTMLLTFLPVVWGIYRYSKDKIGSLAGIMLFEGCLMMYVVTIRQGLAIAFILLALYCYLEKIKKWPMISIGFLTLALSAHSSSFLVIPILCILCWLKIEKSKWLYGILIASVFLGPLLSSIVGDLSFAIISAMGDKMDRISNYAGTSEFVSASAGVARLRVFVPMVVLSCWILYCNKQRDLSIFEKSLVVGVLFFNLASGIMGHLAQRFVAPFYIVAIIGALPYMKHQKYPVVTLILFAYLIKSYNAGLTSTFMTYRFIWE